MLSTPFDDIIVQGVLSTPLRPHIMVFVVILKFFRCNSKNKATNGGHLWLLSWGFATCGVPLGCP
ncbi:hypothetical protein B5J94_02750 [Moraxella lacunata]|uniref:Uncharacterized protein n=1 Tax=Moraxella lacunata TaxID=477 RepID=A0A1V4H1C4_MORLA|nr:hypothetical protein B5J94_02750 [Moraxella lacunata]